MIRKAVAQIKVWCLIALLYLSYWLLRTGRLVVKQKNKFKFDIKEQGFAWIADNKIELKMIKQMRKGSRIMITGYNQKGSQTIDHYSLLGFTKAYNASRKACS